MDGAILIRAGSRSASTVKRTEDIWQLIDEEIYFGQRLIRLHRLIKHSARHRPFIDLRAAVHSKFFIPISPDQEWIKDICRVHSSYYYFRQLNFSGGNQLSLKCECPYVSEFRQTVRITANLVWLVSNLVCRTSVCSFINYFVFYISAPFLSMCSARILNVFSLASDFNQIKNFTTGGRTSILRTKLIQSPPPFLRVSQNTKSIFVLAILIWQLYDD